LRIKVPVEGGDDDGGADDGANDGDETVKHAREVVRCGD
jgi:hypothetical protein